MHGDLLFCYAMQIIWMLICHAFRTSKIFPFVTASYHSVIGVDFVMINNLKPKQNKKTKIKTKIKHKNKNKHKKQNKEKLAIQHHSYSVGGSIYSGFDPVQCNVTDGHTDYYYYYVHSPMLLFIRKQSSMQMPESK